MSIQSVGQAELDFFGLPPICVEVLQEQLSSDAGLLPFRQLDEHLGWTAGLADQIHDARPSCTHTVLEMVRQRVFGILAGYEDQNDHDTLRRDGVFKLLAGRRPDAADLASQPTLSRLENAVTAADLLRLREWFVERFVGAFDAPPAEVTLDVDLFDDPAHGQQQLTLFHGKYDQHQYFVRVITCAENDLVVLPVLLHGTAHGTLGLVDDLTLVAERLREVWPDVRIRLRGDSGFATPDFYEGCEELRIEYSVGLGMNPVLREKSENLLQIAVADWEATGQPQRRFMVFPYQARRWSKPRWTVIKCEANAQGVNRRAVLTSRPGAAVLPQGVYDEYADRGESENRNKELKCELGAGRLSDHRYMANAFRLVLHTLAANLLVRMRRLVAEPPEPAPVASELPFEAQSPQDKRLHWSRRRRADPLGEGHACTWRTLVIKVAARIVVTARRVRVLLSASWPHWRYYLAASQAVAQLSRSD